LGKSVIFQAAHLQDDVASRDMKTISWGAILFSFSMLMFHLVPPFTELRPDGMESIATC
jgi:hypothetical protein